MRDIAAEQERLFREWLRMQMNDEGYRRYTDNAVIAYCYALRTACRKIDPEIEGNLFYVESMFEFGEMKARIFSPENIDRLNQENGNGTFEVALKLYEFFLREGMDAQAPDLEAAFYTRKALGNSSDYSEDRGEIFHYEEVPMKPIQRIYYGAPGTGKSYKVRKMLEAEYPDKKVRDSHCKRLIFHPTYTYEDLIGSIKPMTSPEHPLDYMYMAGPFTALLKESFLHPAERYYLIIEEINRGNAPAIFGDLFQLLDRQDNGKSEYAVQNVDISAYFSRDPGLKLLFNEGKIWLPANFNILATMNTADENIFVLDSAFKRRFALEYVKINYDNLPEEWTKEYPVFAGERPLEEVFAGTPLAGFAGKLQKAGKLKRNWPTFARMTNRIIDMLNQDAIDNDKPELARIPENKKLGPFFVAEEELEDMDSFINKVIFYLKHDVFTYSNHYMKESYEDICTKYEEEGLDLFELLR